MSGWLVLTISKFHSRKGVSFKKAILQVLLSNFTALIASSISTLLLAKALGIYEFGILGLLLVIQNIFMIPIKALQPGLLICYNESMKTKTSRASVFWTKQLQNDFTLRILISIGLMIASAIAYLSFIFWLNWDVGSWPLFLFIYLQAVGFAFEKRILLNLQMRKKFFYFALLASFNRLFKGLSFVILFSLGQLNLTTAIAMTGIASFLIIIFQLKSFAVVRVSHFYQLFENWFLIKKSFWPGLSELIVQLGARSGILVLQLVGGVATVGILAFAEVLIGALSQISQAVISVFSPKILELNNAKKLDGIFIKVGGGGALCLIVLGFLGLPIIQFLFPIKYSLVWLCFIGMLPGLAASYIASFPVVKLHGMQFQKALFIIELLGVFVTLGCLSVVELPLHAALAWSVGRVVYLFGAFFLWFNYKKELLVEGI
ncbi:hypothetical protein OAA91_01760 [Fibrobacterales bacterium]|nr:hypothetical protein [Fibrobacterales bacterium]